MNVSVSHIKYPLIVLMCLIPCGLFAYEPDDCAGCHSGNPGQGIPQISIAEYEMSVHAGLMNCTDCHSHIDAGHEDCETPGNVDCGQCHDQKNLHGASSKGKDKPECYSCHGKHKILPASSKASSINEARFEDTCAQCHPAEWGKQGYLERFASWRIKSHKKQDFSRNFKETNCRGCHQGTAVHGEYEVINDETCYRCHLNNDQNGLMGEFHTGEEPGSFILVLSITSQVLILLILVIVIRFFTCSARKKNKKEGE